MDPEFSLHTEHSVLEIEGKPIGHGADCYVIAEIGHNHQGSVEQAMQLFAKAHECGADAVKLQKRDNRSLYTRDFYNRPYENENSFGATYGEHREALEFGPVEYRTLQEYAQELGVTFFATAFDFASADFLAELDMPAYKIASGDLVNTPLLRYVAEIGKPIIFSTGGATLEDVRRAYETVAEVNAAGRDPPVHGGISGGVEELDLRRHRGPTASSSRRGHRVLQPRQRHRDGGRRVRARSARSIEKHFTLNRAMKGTDHAFSLEPQGLRKMVRDLERTRHRARRRRRRARIRARRAGHEDGQEARRRARSAGRAHCVTEGDIALKSPGDGLPPYELDRRRRPDARDTDASRDEALTFELLDEVIPQLEGALSAEIRVSSNDDDPRPGPRKAGSRSSPGRSGSSAPCGPRRSRRAGADRRQARRAERRPASSRPT